MPDNVRKVALVSYATPDLIPAGLKKVGLVGTAPNNVQVIDPTWVASPDLAPAGLKVMGAVSYASLDLVPAGLKPLTGGYSYLLRDDFTTAQAAPLTSPRTCEPGPGTLTIVDTTNVVSIADGRLVLGNKNSYNDPKAQTVLLTRTDVGAVAAFVRFTGLISCPVFVLDPSETPVNPIATGQGVYVASYVPMVGGGITPAVARIRSIDHLFAILPRTGGGSWLVASGGIYGTFPSATVLWVYDTGTDDVYAQVATKASRILVEHVSVLKAALMPVVYTTRYGPAIAADTFTRADGAPGTSEVGGFTWTTAGTVAIASGKLSIASTAGIAYIPTTGTPRIISVDVTMPGGADVYRASLVFRSNGTTYCHFQILADNTCSLYTFDGAIHNVVTSGPAGGVAAGGTYRMVVIDTGTRVRCFVNTTQVIEAALTTYNTQTGTGVRQSQSGAATAFLFDNFAVWPSTVTLPTEVGPFPVPPVGTGSAIFSDAFTGVDGTALADHDATWTVHVGTWEIRSGKAQMTAANVDAGLATVDSGSTDHEASADVTAPADVTVYPDDWFCGVAARCTDASNYIGARYLYQSNSPEIEVMEYITGSGTLLAFVNLGANALAPSSIHALKLAVKGAEVAAYLDGVLVAQGTTTLLTGTRAGIGVFDGTAHSKGQPTWDGFTVKAT